MRRIGFTVVAFSGLLLAGCETTQNQYAHSQSVLNQEAPLWDGDALTDDERAAVQAAVQRIKNVKDGVSQIEP